MKMKMSGKFSGKYFCVVFFGNVLGTYKYETSDGSLVWNLLEMKYGLRIRADLEKGLRGT